ncbi:MAG: MiaB/RimO family radical SAM methylthiotransferase [Candidatus Peregrinibacteria bacterium]|nr:MiaB/RimO family radical SAM methylthiotransferase [Candidatus Peregrinibacteria bacterium]MDZ4244307.1 MiaB/RimO family radical SAM methylthiotransferase [Candidatus Gracilibacteria bacterium]
MSHIVTKPKFFIKTFGCQMNTSDSERVITVLEALGYESVNEEESLKYVDFVIFNTCSVKQKAEDKMLGVIKHYHKMRKINPNIILGVTGCMVRQTGVKEDVRKIKEGRGDEIPEYRKVRALDLKKRGLAAKKGYDILLTRLTQIDLVFRIEDIAILGNLLKEVNPNLQLNEIVDEGTLENYFKIAPKVETKVQAYVPIMTGCDKFCTYCIVPFTRGREYSRKFEEIIDECTRLVKSGTQEITLVGQTVNTYGLSRMDRASKNFDWYYHKGGQISSAYRGNHPDESGVEKPFITLLKAVDKLKTKGLKRLRYTSPHPRDFTDDVIDAITSLDTICPHIHMPVQSGSNTVLKRMNRNYLAEEYVEILQKMREKIPNLVITTDIIVGFCGETDEEFEETYKMYDALEWDFCYISQYSPRKGTVSERMMDDDISREVKKERWEKMNELMKQKTHKKNKSYEGRVVEVLVERSTLEKDNTYLNSGRTPDSKEIQFISDQDLTGEFVNIKITEGLEWLLRGALR